MMKKDKIIYCLLIVALLVSCEKKEKKNDAVTIEEPAKKEEVLTPATDFILEENLSGELIVLTEEEFVKKITDIDNPKGFQYKGRTPCVVDFYTDWCPPCARLNPVLIELANEYKGKVIFYKINAEKAANASKAFGVQSIPTLILMKPHAMPVIIEGTPFKEDLVSAIETVLLASDKEP